MDEDKEPDVMKWVSTPPPTPKPTTGFCREVFDDAVTQWLSRYISAGLINRAELHGAMSELYELIDQKITK